MNVFLASLLLLAGVYCQFEGHPESSVKSVDAPQPGLVEVPYNQPSYSAPAGEVVTGSQTSVNVAAPTINVPKKLENVVDVPHTPLKLPQGGSQVEDVNYEIPQPVVSMPKLIIQRKPVIFNVPQPIIQVPQPIIRHRPVLYTVPHLLKLLRPIITNLEEQYKIPSANVAKTGYDAVSNLRGLSGSTSGNSYGPTSAVIQEESSNGSFGGSSGSAIDRSSGFSSGGTFGGFDSTFPGSLGFSSSSNTGGTSRSTLGGSSGTSGSTSGGSSWASGASFSGSYGSSSSISGGSSGASGSGFSGSYGTAGSTFGGSSGLSSSGNSESNLSGSSGGYGKNE